MVFAPSDPNDPTGPARGNDESSQATPSAEEKMEARPAQRIGEDTGGEDTSGEDAGKDLPHEDSWRLASNLAAILSHLPGMAFRCRFDEDWTMEYVSAGSFPLTGYPPEDLVDNRVISYGELIHPDDRGAVRDNQSAALGAAKPYDLVYRIRTAAGQEKWVRELGRGLIFTGGEIPMLEGFITDITEHKQSEKRIQRQRQRFDALRQMERTINSSLDLRTSIEILLKNVTTELQVDAADVLLYDPTAEVLEYVAGRGFRTSVFQQTRIRLGEGFAGIAALEQHPVQIQDLATTPAGFREDLPIAEEGFITYFAQPLLSRGQVKGVLEIFHRSRLEPDVEWVDFLSMLASQTAVAIDNATLFIDLQRANIELSLAYDSALEGWSKALELRDKETEGHTQRVTELTLRLARAFGIGARELVHIRRGAILHDIGKMGIPDRILLKNGPLNPEEWEIVRTHPHMTSVLLSPIPYLRPAMIIPYCHHERWDGSGYPRGLRGEQIPLEARIFAVADVWDALTSDRPFRQAWPKEKALEYIREKAGVQFDPKVVEIFLRLVSV
jgi:PAS domain S-box-containing protein